MKVFYFWFFIFLIGCGSHEVPEDDEVILEEPGPSIKDVNDDFIKEFLDAHNEIRSDKNIAPLTWSIDIANTATKWATSLAEKCDFKHSDNNYGENLAMNWGKSSSPKQVVFRWAAEEADYDYDSNTCTAGKACGHYTQIVWRTTQKLGCAMAQCNSQTITQIWVCNYDPPGNWRGEKPY
jgi:pathogenesis-related protein 1